MRYWIRTLIGIAVIAGSVTLASYLIYEMVRVGSCASGGAYVIANPCPAGFGWKVLGIIVSIFVLPFVGMGILATRRPGGGATVSSGASVGALWFFLLFTCMGAAALVAGQGPAAPDERGVTSGANWVAGTFLVMGAPALLGMVIAALRRPKDPPPSATQLMPDRAGMATLANQLQTVATMRSVKPAPTRPAPSTPGADADDLAGRLRQLDELRAAGLVTAEEHAAKRREILGEV
ncbi:MAG: hypothetical protein JWO02_563 [Solirubrobacterales bacterium]|nr:hypothetical protein [Solirubrobacterales bacterium]